MIDKGRIAGWVLALIVGCAILFFLSTVHCSAEWTLDLNEFMEVI